MAAADGFVPAWAADAVWYQIFPERFANGDRGNDPTRASLQGASFGGGPPAGWQLQAWGSDWYAQAPWERDDPRPRWQQLLDRRYGGDLAGIQQRLDYLQSLGVNALYLNPVFDAPSHHKYDSAGLHHVDPHFGPDPEGDRALIAAEDFDDPASWVWTAADRLLLALVDDVHRRGMRVVLDGVFNHVGARHPAFVDLARHGRTSRFADWFTVQSWQPLRVQCWRGHDTLPELRQQGDNLAPGPLAYVEAVTRRWLAPDGDATRGIDGWRLDVAPWLPHGFWRRWRQLVKAIQPEAYLVAEIIREPEFNAPFLQGDEFDAVMNYNFAFACDEFFFSDRERIGASRFDSLLRELRQAYPACVAPAMQNLFGSHDTARLASHAMNRDALTYRCFDDTYHDELSRAHRLDTGKPDAHARALQRLFVLFQMTSLGAPMVYYGDEAGLWGANDPCCRKPMLWPDQAYDAEAVHPAGGPRERADAVAFDTDLFEHYRRCIALRHALPVLRRGAVTTLLADDARQLLVHRRDGDDGDDGDGGIAIVAINRSEAALTARVAAADAVHWHEHLSGATVPAPGGRLDIELAPLAGAVFTPVV